MISRLTTRSPRQYITEAEYCLDLVNKGSMPGAFLVDLVPACKNIPLMFEVRMHESLLTLRKVKHLPGWLPGMGFKKAGADGWKRIEALINRPFRDVKDSMVSYLYWSGISRSGHKYTSDRTRAPPDPL